MESKRLLLLLLVLAALLTVGGVLWFAPRASGTDGWFPSGVTLAEEEPSVSATVVAADGDAVHSVTAGTGAANAAATPRPERRAEDEPLLLAADVLVVDARNQPVAGALVDAATSAGDRDRKATGADGKVQLQLPAAEAVLLRATAAAHLPTTVADHPFGSPATLMLQPAAVVLGRVVDGAGEPIVGARVLAYGPFRAAAANGAAGEAVSDKAGAFRFDCLWPGTYDVRVEAPRSQPDPARVRLGDQVAAGVFLPAGETRIDFPLVGGRTFRGLVRDARTQQPVAGAEINLRLEMKLGQVTDARTGVTLKTDDQGGFRIEGVPVGDGRIWTRSKGFSADMRRVSVRETTGEETLEVLLQPSMTLRGRALTAEGVPVPEATVTLSWGQDNRVRMGPEVKCDGEGRFEFADQNARNGILLVVSKDGLAPGAALVGNVAPGEVRENIEVKFQRGIEVRGRCVDEAGRGIAGAQVTLVPRNVDRFRFHGVTDERGQFVVPFVSPFPYWLEATAEGHGQGGKELPIDNKRTVLEAGDVLLPSVFTLQGRVVRRGLGAAPGVRVTCEPVKGVPGGTQRAATDAFGRFEIKNLRQGRHRLRVEGADVFQPEEPPCFVDVPLASAVRIEVLGTAPEATGALTGRLMDQGTSQPMRGFTVRGVDPRRVAVADGGFTIHGLPAGRYDLQFDAAGYQSVLQPGVSVVAGQTRTLPILWMLPGGQLTVVVVDAQGKPIPADRVRVELADQLARTLPHHLVPVEVQKEQGRLRFDGLALSEFEVTVTGPKGLQPFRSVVPLPSTSPVTVRAVLRPPPPAAAAKKRVPNPKR